MTTQRPAVKQITDRWTFAAINFQSPVWRETLGNTGSQLCRMALWDYFGGIIT